MTTDNQKTDNSTTMSKQLINPTFDHDERSLDRAVGFSEEREEELDQILREYGNKLDGEQVCNSRIMEVVYNDERLSEFEKIFMTLKLTIVIERSQSSPLEGLFRAMAKADGH